MMDERTVNTAMQILIHSGDARRETYKAVEAIEAGDFEESGAALARADDAIREAHKVHTDLIQSEAGGEEVVYSLLFTHAQDTLMTTYSELHLVKKLAPVLHTYDQRLRALEERS